jgi:hypothetical protein
MALTLIERIHKGQKVVNKGRKKVVKRRGEARQVIEWLAGLFY